MRKNKPKHEVRSFCLEKKRQVSCECVTNANVMREHDKCHAKTLQVLCEYVTSVMLKRDKCHAETCKRHTNM